MKNITETNKQEGILSFLIAFTLINTVSFVLLFSSLVFAAGGGMNWWLFPFSYALAIFVNYFAADFSAKDGKRFNFFRSSLIASVVIIISIFIAGFFYDTSADGLVYHQETVYQLSGGWNPFNTVLPDSVSQSTWINHYPKGAEVPQSAIYSLVNKIESGKATNILLLVAGFFICLSFFSKNGLFLYKKRLLLSTLLSLNPVTINQLFTFYIDGQMASLLLCFIAICALLYNDINKYYLFLLGSVMLIVINLKFTGIVFVAIFSTGFMLLLLINRKWRHLRKVFYLILISGSIAVVFVGYNPYVKNSISHGHPFYPLMGRAKIDVIKESYPIGFADKGRFEKFYISLFAHTDNEGSWAWEERVPTLKIPFSFNKIDIANARTEDTRVAGFGPFFSGILLVAMLLFVWSAFENTTNRSVGRKVIYIAAVILISVFLIPEAWWARYVPQCWLIPLLFFIAAEFNQRRWVKISGKILYLVIVGNICIALLSVPYRVLMTMQLDYQLSQLKASGQTIKVSWGNARANRIRFNERQIPFEEQEGIETKAVEIIGSDSKFELPGTIPEVPMPFLLKWWRGVKPLEK